MSLGELQNFLQDYVTCSHQEFRRQSEEPGGTFAAERIEELVKPSATLSAAQRIAIYRTCYFVRMLDALCADYPALESLIGSGPFEELALRYLERHPSQTFSLNWFGDHFAEFVAAELPDHGAAIDLARLEATMVRVFHAPESPRIAAEQLSEKTPEEWLTARFTPAAALHLLSLDHPVSAYYTAFRRDEPRPELAPQPSYVMIYRSGFKITRSSLGRGEWELVTALASGSTVAESLEGALPHLDEASMADTLFARFREWVQGGVFQSVTFETDRTESDEHDH